MCSDDLYLENEYSFDNHCWVSEAVTARLKIIKSPGRKMEGDYFEQTN